MKSAGVNFMFDKVHMKIVPVLPIEGEDKGWSINDVLEMPVDPSTLHIAKCKYDIMQETMSIVSATFGAKVCEAFESLIEGIYDPYGYTEDDFRMIDSCDKKQFKPKPLSRILGLSGTKRKAVDDNDEEEEHVADVEDKKDTIVPATKSSVLKFRKVQRATRPLKRARLGVVYADEEEAYDVAHKPTIRDLLVKK
ncbi:hypothetical protein ElyMa_004524300 [Elysia marginata]|uniref:Uncharacterized protein n=1 Tax=Elysia marginata TaxID=1093978 RepID=A0AAV4HNJ7_9GAST|nr:hypothetical protein ElyMa_004524300 [Elysia marginata]